jgi:hypothetical protein
MGVFLVTFDLADPGRTRPAVLDEIRKSAGWAKLSSSTYAVTTQEFANQLLARVRKQAHPDDTIYVISLRKAWEGHGAQEVSQWLSTHLHY